MSNTYTIGPNGPTSGSALTAIYQPGRGQGPVTIYNAIGGATCYVDNEDPLGNPTNGIPLTAGSSLPWDGDQALYIVCPTSTQVVISDNSQTGTDAGAVASQLIAQGLATDIANAIALTGAPPIDKFAPLPSLPLTLATLNGAVTSASIDVSAYQSISVLAKTSNPGPTNNTRVNVNWCDSLGNVLFTEYFFVGNGGQTISNMTVRGAMVYFSLINLGAGVPVVLTAYGSYKSLASNYALVAGAGTTTGVLDGGAAYGVSTWSGNIPASTTWTCQPDVIAGPVDLAMRYTNTNTTGFARILRIPTTIFGLTTYLAEGAGTAPMPTVPGQQTLESIYLPAMPVELSIQNLSTTQTINFRATFTSLRPYAS
jgi:hypothetical protein